MRIVNRKARMDYFILETLEAGIVLSGFEIKSIRAGRVNLSDSFARIQNGEVLLKNLYIHPFQNPPVEFNASKDRKLLLHKQQIAYLASKTVKTSVSLIPLSLYFKHNFIKVELAVAGSKKKYDKRRAIKEKDMQRKLEQEIQY